MFKRVAVLGGAGYVGSALTPHLASLGYDLKIIDLFLYQNPDTLSGQGSIRNIKGDIRDESLLRRELADVDAVIHLACISNDPSFELDPRLGKSINYDAFLTLLKILPETPVRRLVYASSSSVYGVKSEPDVHEEMLCEPLTDYSTYKWKCEEALKERNIGNCEFIILRPATVCGFAPRLRLDLTVNLLTLHALVNRTIRVFGGEQLRPNIHIQDMIEAYRLALESPGKLSHGQTFNAGYENLSVIDIANLIRRIIGEKEIQIRTEDSPDKRSYHINSDKIRRVLGFQPKHTVEDAVKDLCEAYREGRITDPLNNPLYHNIKRMRQLNLGELAAV